MQRRGSAIGMVVAFITVTAIVASGIGYLSSGRRRAEAMTMSDYRAAAGKCWTAPVVVNKRLYVRNAAGALTCYLLEGGALTAEPLPPDREVNLSY